ncbi:hypothetical protein [Cupriavidus sp. H39]|uniref:hypothetical protein n=1 Tax=Cupriavidus sp. H39 TaxID=3401635 RepID=UPI003D08ACC2
MSTMSETVSRALDRESLAAWTVRRTRAGRIKRLADYVDMATGEVIPAAEASIPLLDLRTKLAEKEAALNSLRPEVRAFAYFVLCFANKRRGITPGIYTLCHWYADITGKRADNVRRYVPKLEQAGILAGENLLGKLWQRTAGKPSECMGEEAIAACRYQQIKWKLGQGRKASGCDRDAANDPAYAIPAILH